VIHDNILRRGGIIQAESEVPKIPEKNQKAIFIQLILVAEQVIKPVTV